MRWCFRDQLLLLRLRRSSLDGPFISGNRCVCASPVENRLGMRWCFRDQLLLLRWRRSCLDFPFISGNRCVCASPVENRKVFGGRVIALLLSFSLAMALGQPGWPIFLRKSAASARYGWRQIGRSA